MVVRVSRKEWPTRFLFEVGTRAWLRVYWGDDCAGSYHNAMHHLLDSEKLADFKLGGEVGDYNEDSWPMFCDRCGQPVPLNVRTDDDSDRGAIRQVFHRRLYRAPDGRSAVTRSGLITDEDFQTGDLWLLHWHEPGECWYWDNCDGRHLHVKLPNGREWDVDSRASNCTLKDEKTHRCWVRRGDPERGEPVDVGKAGHTCKAGAGSIQAGDFHGFLHNGVIHT